MGITWDSLTEEKREGSFMENMQNSVRDTADLVGMRKAVIHESFQLIPSNLAASENKGFLFGIERRYGRRVGYKCHGFS